MSAQPASPVGKLSLEIRSGPHSGHKMNFAQNQISLGRAIENDIVLTNDAKISRKHLELNWFNYQWHFKNLSQKNNLLLNDVAVTEGVINPGDRLQVGESEILWQYDAPSLQIATQARSNVIQMPLKKSLPEKPTATTFKMSSAKKPESNSYLSFAIVLGVLFALYFFTKRSAQPTSTKSFRTAEELQLLDKPGQDILQEFKDRKERLGNLSYQKALEHFVHGYRDYRSGQYQRAREAFQIVVNLDPENELAKRYKQLSEIKLDEMIQFHLLQGNRYLEKANYRLCRSSFRNVMTMLGGDYLRPEYKEAKAKYQQCDSALEGRF